MLYSCPTFGTELIEWCDLMASNAFSAFQQPGVVDRGVERCKRRAVENHPMPREETHFGAGIGSIAPVSMAGYVAHTQNEIEHRVSEEPVDRIACPSWAAR